MTAEDEKKLARLTEVAHELLLAAEMAYWGNLDERVALRMVRSRLAPFFAKPDAE